MKAKLSVQNLKSLPTSFAPYQQLQRKCACGQHTVAGSECAECHQKRPQRRAANHHGPTNVPHIVHEVLRSPGQPLAPATRAFMEPRFGHDFSQVRVHTDGKAVGSARAANALAYTAGSDIAFAENQYAPGTADGRRLIAHELTHVIQQSGAGSSGQPQSKLAINQPGDSFEQEADAAAGHIMAGSHAGQSVMSTHPILQRQPQPEQRDSPPAKEEGEAARVSTGSTQKSATVLDGFALDSDMLTPTYLGVINTLAWSIALHMGMLANGRATISITGHTDRSGDEKYNQGLGQRRADNVHTALEKALLDQKIAADRIAGWRVTSLGETKPNVDTPDGAKEPRNRRVEIEVTIESLRAPTEIEKPDPLKLPPSAIPPVYGQAAPPKIPTVPTPSREWLEQALKRDPLLKTLPKWAHDKVVDGLKGADELAADKIIDLVLIDDKEKAAMKAAIKSLLQLIKGKKFQMPIPPLHEPPPSMMPEMPKAPGEKIFKLPPIRF